MTGKNGYVKDCSSLGPDVIPEGVAKVMPKAVTGKKGAALKAKSPAPFVAHAKLYSTDFYKTLV
jgi:hypothetical protein